MPAARPPAPSFYSYVYEVVRAVPRGCVVNYGQVASWLGSPRAARAVGYALAARLPDDVPWQRVVNAKGEISIGGAAWRPDEQRRRLRAEGIRFNRHGAIDLRAVAFVPSATQRRRWARLGPRIHQI